jgi:hypothetical protein
VARDSFISVTNQPTSDDGRHLRSHNQPWTARGQLQPRDQLRVARGNFGSTTNLGGLETTLILRPTLSPQATLSGLGQLCPRRQPWWFKTTLSCRQPWRLKTILSCRQPWRLKNPERPRTTLSPQATIGGSRQPILLSTGNQLRVTQNNFISATNPRWLGTTNQP